MVLVWGNHFLDKILIFTLMFYFNAGADSNTPDVPDVKDENEAASMELYENSLQRNYQTGLVKMLEFFEDMSGKLSKINERMNNLEALVADGKKELENKMISVSNTMTGSLTKMNGRINKLETMAKDGQEELRKEIVSVSEDFISFVTPESPSMTSTGCGGVLEAGRGVPYTIRYPNGGKYREYERCVWTLSPKNKVQSYRIKIQSFGMTIGSAGVIVYFLNTTSADLQAQAIREFGSWISFPGPYALITFCCLSGGDRGFEASIVGFGIASDSPNLKPFWLTNPHDSLSYSQDTASNDEIVSVVVQPPNDQYVNVPMTLPQFSNVAIKLYVLRCNHGWGAWNYLTVKSSSSRSESKSLELHSESSYFPVVALLKPIGRSSGVGLTVSY